MKTNTSWLNRLSEVATGSRLRVSRASVEQRGELLKYARKLSGGPNFTMPKMKTTIVSDYH